LTLGVFGLGAGGALAATPSSLAGEAFTGAASVTCATDGSFTFSASGTATGPYPGTFTESGSGTIIAGDLTAFSARFSIASSAGRVTGSKGLPLPVFGPLQCIAGAILGFGDSPATVNYAATINGAYRDTGTAVVVIPNNPPEFREDFLSSNGVVPLQNDNGQGNNNNQGT
jgi:hypothetical protein